MVHRTARFVFNRVRNPDRFFRYYRAGYVMFGLSWLPFAGGIALTAREIGRDLAPQPAIVRQISNTIPKRETSYGLAAGLIAASYVLGYAGAIYGGAGHLHYTRRRQGWGPR